MFAEKLSVEEFKSIMGKTLKKNELTYQLEEAIISILRNDKDKIEYKRLCQLLDFYTYHFMSQRIKPKDIYEYDPITGKLKSNQAMVKNEED